MFWQRKIDDGAVGVTGGVDFDSSSNQYIVDSLQGVDRVGG